MAFSPGKGDRKANRFYREKPKGGGNTCKIDRSGGEIAQWHDIR